MDILQEIPKPPTVVESNALSPKLASARPESSLSDALPIEPAPGIVTQQSIGKKDDRQTSILDILLGK